MSTVIIDNHLDLSTLYLEEKDVQQLKSFANELSKEFSSVESDRFLQQSSVLATQLPNSILSFLHEFKYREPTSSCVIKNFTIDEEQIKNTPTHYRIKQSENTALQEEILLCLFSAALGDIFGWDHQKESRNLIHNILPMKKHEHDQVSSGSENPLMWHTECAFNPFLCDYIGFFCLRNLEKVGTSYASTRMVNLDAFTKEEYTVLFEKRFITSSGGAHDKGLTRRTAVFSGDQNDPYMNIDPAQMKAINGDKEAQQALNKLIDQLQHSLKDIVLEQGDICFIDNFRSIHGRRAFKPRYDGKVRWIKRIYVTRDIRKSRANRTAVESRFIQMY